MDLKPEPTRRAYDHRLRDLTCKERNPHLFARLGVPRSTAASWLRRGPRAVVSAELLDDDHKELQARVLKLERRIDLLLALLRLLSLLVRLSGARLDADRLPPGASKLKVLDAVRRATRGVPLAVALRVLGLSATRYHAWRQLEPDCILDDRSSCPKTKPTQLTPAEIGTMHQMVTDDAYRHISVRGIALLAQRLSKVFAAPATWYALIRERGWLRPYRRVCPQKPTLGLRATKPNEYWHIDVTLFRLLDGSRVYLHAVIDNYSRRILAWKAALRLEPQATCHVLLEASSNLPANNTATVVADSGVEIVNGQVDSLLAFGRLRRVLAQVDISFSNSMIEAWWRSLKHHWLYLNQLDTLAAVERHVGFYVQQHNSVMPHSAFRGQTPDEMYFGTGARVPDDLADARLLARQARIASNRALRCEDCRPPSPQGLAPPPEPDSPAIPSVLHLQAPNSQRS